MDCACVLKDEASTRVEELLIIGTVETIFVDADGIQLPQLEAYAPKRVTADEPPYVEQGERPAFRVFPSPWH